MNGELARKHLEKTRDTVTEVDRIVSSHTYPGDSRTVMVRALLSTIIQHHRSVLLLVQSGIIASSYALTRDIVKSVHFGLWIISCATQEQLRRIEGDQEFPLSLSEIKGVYGKDSHFYDLKTRWVMQLYKYTRTGIAQFGRDFEEAEIRDLTTTATLCVLELAAPFLADQKHSADSKQIETLAMDYFSQPFPGSR